MEKKNPRKGEMTESAQTLKDGGLPCRQPYNDQIRLKKKRQRATVYHEKKERGEEEGFSSSNIHSVRKKDSEKDRGSAWVWEKRKEEGRKSCIGKVKTTEAQGRRGKIYDPGTASSLQEWGGKSGKA